MNVWLRHDIGWPGTPRRLPLFSKFQERTPEPGFCDQTPGYHIQPLLIAGVLVILGNLPAAGAFWSGLPTIGSWVFTVPVAAAMRGIYISTGVGIVATGLRVLLGREVGTLGLGE